MKLELYYPVKPLFLNQGFGENPEMYKQYGILGHQGWDFFAKHGTPVRAAHDGEVVYVGIESKEGIGVVLRTLEPKEYEGGTAYIKSIYWHLINNVPVKLGQKVKAGEIIGYADNTGYSTGDHLHFAIKPQAKGENDWTWENVEQNNGYKGAIDPTTYFNRFFAEDAVKVGLIKRALELAKKLLELIRKNNGTNYGY